MANYQLRRRTGQTIGAMLGSMLGQAKAERSLQQLETDIESLRDVADKSNMSVDDFGAKLSSLYAHHGVRRGPGFQADVNVYANKVGRRESAEFAKELYPDAPLPDQPSVSGAGDYGRLKRWDESAIETGEGNREQGRMRGLMSRFSPAQQMGYYSQQENAARAAEAKREADQASWTRFFLKLNEPKPDEMATLYGPNGATKQVPIPYGEEFIPPEGWSFTKPAVAAEKGPTWDATRGAFVYPDGRVVIPENLPERTATGAGATPSNIIEWNFFNKLSSEDQERFLTMKRATQNINLGGSVVQPSMTQPGVAVGTFEKTLPPEKLPENIAAQETAKLTAKTAVTKQTTFPKIKASMNSLNRQWNTVEKTIDRAINQISPFTAGLGAWAAIIPAGPQRTLREDLNTIRANIGFDKLQDMRQNSPTGGALGQVSDHENRLLQAVQGSLDQGLSPAVLKAHLQDIKELLQLTREEKNAAFQSDYAEFMQPQQIAPQQQTALPSTNAQGWQLMQDANGNRAYVGPNGEVQEVQ